MAEKITEVIRKLAHWQRDPDLAGIRDEARLRMLPAEEAERWRKVWRDVETSLTRAKAKQ